MAFQRGTYAYRLLLDPSYSEGSGGGFPIVANEEDSRRMYGYISSKELEHGLAGASDLPLDSICTFATADAMRRGVTIPASQISTPGGRDFSWLIEIAPIQVALRSPMELVHEVRSVPSAVVVSGC